MQVAVLMYYDDAIQEYAEINYKINKIYCDKYGLELIVSHKRTYTERHPAWERLPLIHKHLKNYDYIVWIDADAFFYSDARNIVDIIQENPDSNFIFSNDIGNTNINTGIFIARNSIFSLIFIYKWAHDEVLYQKNSHPSWWSQGVLIDMVKQNVLRINNHHVCYPYGQLQHFYEQEELPKKPFIFHLAGRDYTERLKASRNYAKQIGLNV
jgi:hypothetical protein